eukprot:1152993-Pelagomonas_calceolata.AAC.1
MSTLDTSRGSIYVGEKHESRGEHIRKVSANPRCKHNQLHTTKHRQRVQENAAELNKVTRGLQGVGLQPENLADRLL